MELFKLLGKIVVDNSEANKALSDTSSKAKGAADDLGDAASSGEKSGGKFSGALKKIGSGALAVGKTVATGLAAGTAALGGLTVSALNAAGELEQNMGGSEAVFKDYAERMQATAKTAFSDMGLSASDFLGTANKMGALFQGAGFSIEESADLSSSAMQRAADVASIMGIDTASAMEAIAGAAKGNFTMMDNLGVAMNDTTLNAYALEKGLDKTTKEMTNQEKIGLAMEMFMERTAYAAGNYRKENETLAGSLGTAKAALSNFISGAGSVEDVVTSFSNAAQVIVKNVNEIFPALMTGITQMVNQLVPMIPPLLEQLLPQLITGATNLINGLVAAMPQIVSALMAALPALIQGVTQIVNALIAALPQIVQAIVAALPTLLPALIDGIVSMIVTLCTMTAQIIQPIIDILPEVIIAVTDALMRNLPALIMGVAQLIVGLAMAIPDLCGALWEALKGVFSTAVSYMSEWFQPIADWFSEVWASFVEIVSTVWDAISNVISIGIQLIASILDAAFQIITLPFRFIWENCKETIIAAWDAIKSAVSTAINAVKDFITNVFNAVKNTVTNVWNAIKNAISKPVNAAKETVINVFNTVKSTIGNVVNNIKTTVTNTFNKVKTAMTSPIEKARDTIKGIIDKIKGFFSGLKLQFPSIKLPHFGISPAGWKIGDLLKGSIPKLSIDWYAKAMQNPMVMTQPTVFGYDSATGQLMGGGEAGAEVVTGATTLSRLISSAVASQNSAIVAILQQLLSVLAEYFPQILDAMGGSVVLDTGVLVGEIAVPMDRALGKISSRRERGR